MGLIMVAFEYFITKLSIYVYLLEPELRLF